jgi:phosphopantothenoylcysteine decarboxylase/phosphopantothenate--cysteine ligase
LVRRLQQEDFDVHCILTKAGQQFVAPQALAAVSGNPVLENEYFSEEKMPGILASPGFSHIDIAKKADLILVAPASADTIARLAHGRANGLLETAVMMSKSPILIAPAMNTDMFASRTNNENMALLHKRGIEILPTEEGELACGVVGSGRLLPIEDIVFYAQRVVSEKHLTGKKILITLGGTEEPLDPVRILTNRSSGKMGIALAKEAFFRGAEVVVVAGSIGEDIPNIFSRIVPVRTAKEMLQETKKHISEVDISFFVAAVSDFTPAEYSKNKIPSESEVLLSLKKNPDIAFEIGKKKRSDQRFYGFALQTDPEKKAVEKGRQKMEKKNLDGIFVNSPQNLGSELASGVFLTGDYEHRFSGTKKEVCRKIFECIR